jgi:hypothetical protein
MVLSGEGVWEEFVSIKARQVSLPDYLSDLVQRQADCIGGPFS